MESPIVIDSDDDPTNPEGVSASSTGKCPGTYGKRSRVHKQEVNKSDFERSPSAKTTKGTEYRISDDITFIRALFQSEEEDLVVLPDTSKNNLPRMDNSLDSSLFCLRHSLGNLRIYKKECISCGVDHSKLKQAQQIQQKKILDSFIKSLGKKRERNLADGHCILHSFLHGLHEEHANVPGDVQSLFPLIKAEILENLSLYAPFVGDIDLLEELDDYFHARRFDCSIVDLMLHVLANVTKTTVTVYSVKGQEVQTLILPPTNAVSKYNIYLSKVGNHYEAVIKGNVVSTGKKQIIELTDDVEANDAASSDDEKPYFYQGDPQLPVYARGLTVGMGTKDIVHVLLGAAEENPDKICTAVPTNVSHNTCFILDSWKLKDVWDVKCDDMGSWVNNGRKCQRKESIKMKYDVYRQFYVNRSLPSLRKSLVYLKNEKEMFRYVFNQYIFSEGETKVIPKPHGRAKNENPKPYKRTMPSTVSLVKASTAKPREIMHSVIDKRGGIENVRSAAEYPRDRKQIYRVRGGPATKSSEQISNDPLMQLLKLSKEQQQGRKEDWFVREVQLSNEQTVFLANDQQLLDVERFCTNPADFSVFSVDATFNVANHYFTFGTYRNCILETSRGCNPVCIGPGILHKRKLESSYYALPSLMVKYQPKTRGVLVYGTDGETNLSSALGSVFDAIHLRCDMHLKDNVKSTVSQHNVPQTAKSEIFKDIFGFEVDGARQGGLVDCTSEEEFDTSIEAVKKKWSSLKADKFLDFFLNNQAPVIKESLRADIRSMCGLGYPPVAYSQNGIECLNRYIKENASGSDDVTKNLVRAVVNINAVVKRQFDEQFLAVLGKGTYRLAKGYEFLKVNEDSFYRMSPSQKEQLKRKFFTISVSEKRGRSKESESGGNASKLSVEADKSGIITVPFELLEKMFSKAEELVDKTWKIPGTEDTWMVPSSTNPKTPHTVTTASSGKVSCDSKCANYCAYSICAHTVAVAQEAAALENFLKWHKRQKGTSNVTKLSSVGLPEKSGKKGTKATQRRKGKANKVSVTPAATVTSRILPEKPTRPEPPFGTFAVASLRYLDPKVSVCYGCRTSLKQENRGVPPSPEDLVIVTRLRRDYYKDGVKVTSPDLSNVYYHVNPNCVTQRHTFFIPALIRVPSDLQPFLDSNHKRCLFERLGVKTD